MKKKLLVIAAAVTMLVMSLTGCKKETECDMCGELQKCDSYEILGEEVYMCDDCYEAWEAVGDLLN